MIGSGKGPTLLAQPSIRRFNQRCWSSLTHNSADCEEAPLLVWTGLIQDVIDRAEAGESALQQCDPQDARKPDPGWVYIHTQQHSESDEPACDPIVDLAFGVHRVSFLSLVLANARLFSFPCRTILVLVEGECLPVQPLSLLSGGVCARDGECQVAVLVLVSTYG